MIFFWKLFLYGNIGLLIEVWFTGIHSLITKNYRGTSVTYVYMFLIYGLTAMVLEQLHHWLRWGMFLNALVYVPTIYLMEFTSGWVLQKLLGRCPWDYGNAKYGIMGLIRLDYAPYWFLIALFFDAICGWIDVVLNKIVLVA